MKKVIMALVLMVPLQIFAHGEDKPGPHGGIIRMPGAFHTELIPVDEQTLKVYLLDINFEEAVTDNSSVKATYTLDGTESATNCIVEEDYFKCNFSKPISREKGVIKLESSRLGSGVGTSLYEMSNDHKQNDHHMDHEH